MSTRELLARFGQPWFGLPVLIFSLITQVIPGTHSDAGPSTPVMAQQTTVRSSSTRSGSVILPRNVNLEDVRVSISGRGRLVGFVLREKGHTSTPATFYGFVTNRCGEPACKGEGRPFGYLSRPNIDDGILIAGEYELFVIADGAPVRVRFKFPSLSGHKKIHLDRQRDVQIETFPSLTGGGSSLQWGGGFTQFEQGDGLAALSMWADGSGTAAFDDCHYNFADTAPPPETAFLPGCPTGRAQPQTSEREDLTLLST